MPSSLSALDRGYVELLESHLPSLRPWAVAWSSDPSPRQTLPFLLLLLIRMFCDNNRNEIRCGQQGMDVPSAGKEERKLFEKAAPGERVPSPENIPRDVRSQSQNSKCFPGKNSLV